MSFDKLTMGIDIGSTTVKIAIINPDDNNKILFSDYRRHFANIQQTICDILKDADKITGDAETGIVITGSGGLAISSHLNVAFVQEVVAVATALEYYAPKTDVAIELGG